MPAHLSLVTPHKGDLRVKQSGQSTKTTQETEVIHPGGWDHVDLNKVSVKCHWSEHKYLLQSKLSPGMFQEQNKNLFGVNKVDSYHSEVLTTDTMGTTWVPQEIKEIVSRIYWKQANSVFQLFPAINVLNCTIELRSCPLSPIWSTLLFRSHTSRCFIKFIQQ